MKSFLLFLAFFIANSLFSQEKQRKALFVIVDGIPQDVIERMHLPHLDSIAKIGGYMPAHVGGERGGYSQTPTISAPGYNNLLTGTWANKHNVWGNDVTNPNYNYWSIFRVVKNAAPKKKLAIFSTWVKNRTRLIGEGLPPTDSIMLDYHFDGLEKDSIRFPHDKGGEFYHLIDEEVTNKAASYVKENGPDLSWVYLEYTDEMGHQHGVGRQMDKAIEIADSQIGRIWDAIRYRMDNFREDWVIYITTDHGRDTLGGYGHGKQSDRERSTWIVTNAQGLNQSTYHRNAGVIDIMPSIVSFMNLEIPRPQKMEVDGVSLVGKLSADSATLSMEGSNLVVRWKPLDPKGKAKIWLATTNNFKTGGTDDYKLVSKVPVKEGKSTIDVSKMSSKFYKVVIEAPYNMLNRWITL